MSPDYPLLDLTGEAWGQLREGALGLSTIVATVSVHPPLLRSLWVRRPSLWGETSSDLL